MFSYVKMSSTPCLYYHIMNAADKHFACEKLGLPGTRISSHPRMTDEQICDAILPDGVLTVGVEKGPGFCGPEVGDDRYSSLGNLVDPFSK